LSPPAKKAAANCISFYRTAGIKNRFFLSPVVVAEIYAGAFQREHKKIETLFSLCKRISIDSETGLQAGHYAHRYRKTHQGISLEDYLPAACAKQNRCPLWTGSRYPTSPCSTCRADFLWPSFSRRSSSSPSRTGSPSCLSIKVSWMCWMVHLSWWIRMVSARP
jgi:predicted nucleic acid-binding protein